MDVKGHAILITESSDCARLKANAPHFDFCISYASKTTALSCDEMEKASYYFTNCLSVFYDT